MNCLKLTAIIIFVVLLPLKALADAGRTQFNKCIACHSLEKGVHQAGPSLAGLAGRKAGTVSNFSFSEAMVGSEIIWNQETLSAFLEEPTATIPGNLMPFGGIRNVEQREVLVEFLLKH